MVLYSISLPARYRKRQRGSPREGGQSNSEPWQMNSNATLKILKEDARKGSLKRQEGNSEGTRTKNSKACTGVQGGQEAQSKGKTCQHGLAGKPYG